MSTTLTKIPVKLLGDLIAPRALERMLQEGALMRGVQVDQLDIPTLEDILKRDVFKRLQLSIPAPLAKKRVIEVLDQIHNPQPEELSISQERPLAALEESARKFSLYFDWPETQRLRGVLGIARQDEEAGKDIRKLVQEGQDLIESMERRLREGLVAQAQDLAQLKADYERVEGVGGREVKRLESLIGQIEDAQGENTLVTGEVERAQNLVFKLRKKLESSMMQPAAVAAPDPETLARVMAIEREHVVRRLSELDREYKALFRISPTVEQQHQALCKQADEGQLSAEAVDNWRNELERAKDHVLAKQREELLLLEQKMRDTFGTDIPNESRVALDVARLTLNGGNLANDEMNDLRNVVSAMSYAPNVAARILDQQRDLTDLERSAREVAGAAEELMPRINSAREELVRGREVDLAPLYSILERYMGEAAQQREDFDARADNLIAEYDKIRSMRGERAQELGRLAETLRAQRRLGPMSANARERYAQTLESAEALLGDARAEYKAAQEVTSNFGADAVSDLLDVFDMGGLEEQAPTPQAPQAQVPQATQSQQPSQQSFITAAPQPAQEEYTGFFSTPATSEAPTKADPAQEAQARVAASFEGGGDMQIQPPAIERSGSSVETWQMTKGEVTSGSMDPEAMQLALMLSLSDAMSFLRLDMADQTHVWSARYAGSGRWRVARALDWQSMDDEVGEWLDHGTAN